MIYSHSTNLPRNLHGIVLNSMNRLLQWLEVFRKMELHLFLLVPLTETGTEMNQQDNVLFLEPERPSLVKDSAHQRPSLVKDSAGS